MSRQVATTRVGAPEQPTHHLVAVVADDLTGAADSTAPFAARGLGVSIVLDGDLPDEADVVALVTDTRWRSAVEARERTQAAVERLRAWGPQILFVKIDSTLRGRVRHDVEAALGTWGCRDAIATPAFPGQGRTVRDGALFVHGSKAVESVADFLPPGVRHPDVLTQEDLVVAARTALDEGLVAVGSGGLSRALASLLASGVAPGRTAAAPQRRAASLLVVGTPHATTEMQVQHIVRGGALVVDVGADRREAVDRACAALRASRRVVLRPRVTKGVSPDGSEAAALAAGLAEVVRDVATSSPPAGLVLTGGATAYSVAEVLKARELRVLGEVAEGLPRGELSTPAGPVTVVTKSGGFGPPDYLSLAAKSLEEHA